MYEFAGLFEWSISTKLVCNRASPEPIAHSGPAVLRISSSRICRNVGGLFAGLSIGEPFLLVFKAAAAYKSAGLLEWSKLIVQWSDRASPEPVAPSGPALVRVKSIGLRWNVGRFLP